MEVCEAADWEVSDSWYLGQSAWPLLGLDCRVSDWEVWRPALGESVGY